MAAALLVRAGWLPERHRQDTAASLRDQVTEKGVAVSSTPFVLGSLLDRLQLRVWTKGPLLRDVASVNAMTLAWLSPRYTFIVDPDGAAEASLLDIAPDSKCSAMRSGISDALTCI